MAIVLFDGAAEGGKGHTFLVLLLGRVKGVWQGIHKSSSPGATFCPVFQSRKPQEFQEAHLLAQVAPNLKLWVQLKEVWVHVAENCREL